MAQAKVAVRLGTEGKQEVVRDFKDVGDAGDAAANRAAKSFERAAQDMESAQRRQAAAAQKLVALLPADKRAQVSMSPDAASMPSKQLFIDNQKQMALYEQQAQALRLALDPVAAAQQRFNVEMGAARTLVSRNAITLDEYVGKLRMEQAALDQSVAAHRRVGASTGAMRNGMQQAGFQVQDFLVQVQGGTSATRAFSQQAPQMIGSLQMMTHGAEAGSGRFAKFASIIGGPWGVALGVAIPLAGIFAEKLFNDEKASKAAQKAAEDHKAAIEALTQAMDASVQTASDKARADFIALETERQDTLAIREKTAALLEQAQARLKLAESSPGNATNNSEWAASVAAAQADATNLQEKIAANQKEIDRLNRTAGIAQGNYIARILDDLRTPEGRVNSRFDRQRQDIIRTERDPTRQANAIARLEASRDAELKKIQETDKALRGSTAALTQFLMPVNGTITSGFGARNAPKAGASTNHQAIDIAVPTGTAIKAPAVGVVEAIGYSESLGKFVVINHGGGTKTRYGHLSDNSIVAKGEAVQQGDMIGRAGSTGRSTGPHLHYQVMVNGKPVDPRKGLFPTDGAGVEMTAATRDATQAQRELDAAMGTLQQRFDPAAASAKAYREELEKIAVLLGAGKITPAQAADWKQQAANAQTDARAQAFLPGFKDEMQPDLAAEDKRSADDEARRKAAEQMLGDLAEQNQILDVQAGLIRASADTRDREMAKLRVIMDLRRAGIPIEGEDAQAILESADALEQKRQAVAAVTQRWEEMRRIGENAIDRLFDPTSAESWGDRVKGVLRDLTAELFRMAAINPLKNLLFGSGLSTLGGGSSGGGGLLGGLFGSLLGGGAGGGADAVMGGAFNSFMSRGDGGVPSIDQILKGGWDFDPVSYLGAAIGHDYTPAGAMLVGENGPEIVDMPRGARVMTASDTRRAMNDNGPAVSAPVTISIDATGADAAGLARVEAQVAQLRAELPSRIVSTVQDAQNRLYLRGRR